MGRICKNILLNTAKREEERLSIESSLINAFSKLDNPRKTPPLIFIHCEHCKEIHELKHNCNSNSNCKKKGGKNGENIRLTGKFLYQWFFTVFRGSYKI